MKTVLDIVGLDEAQGAPCLLQFDEYVPLRLRTYEKPLGAGYVRLGNYSTTLVELILEPNRKVLRGVTITSYDAVSPWPNVAIASISDGLPMLALEFDRTNRIDIKEDFCVAVRPGEILLFWEDLGECRACTFANRVQFLVQDNRLSGVRFFGLSDEETKLFASHAQRH